MFIEINLRKKKLLCLSYNPHKNTIGTHLKDISRILDTKLANYDNYFIIGDLNVEITETALDDFCSSYNLKSLIKEPKCIDLMLTNSHRSFQNSLAIETGLSDFHKMTVTVLKMTFLKLTPKIVTYRNYKKFDNNSFREGISKHCNRTSFEDINDNFQSFLDVCT